MLSAGRGQSLMGEKIDKEKIVEELGYVNFNDIRGEDQQTLITWGTSSGTYSPIKNVNCCCLHVCFPLLVT